jgi:hypothetical protein
VKITVIATGFSPAAAAPVERRAEPQVVEQPVVTVVTVEDPPEPEPAPPAVITMPSPAPASSADNDDLDTPAYLRRDKLLF